MKNKVEYESNTDVEEKILELLDMDNSMELIEEYIRKIKENNPDYVRFLETLAGYEASGNYDTVSESGTFLGLYQIGPMTLKDIQFKNENGEWTELAKKLEIVSDESFLKNETAQEVAILFALRSDYKYITRYGDHNRIGEIINGEVITKSGLIAGAHLVGCKALHDAIVANALDETKDGNGTTALFYMQEMGGLDLSGILVGI